MPASPKDRGPGLGPTADWLEGESSPLHDELARFAAGLLNVPMIVVAVVVDGRAHYLSQVGTEVVSGQPVGAFVAWTIEHQAPLTLADASAEAEFASHPLVTGDSAVRAVAAVPLHDDEGTVGGLCALDRVRREWAPAEVALLEAIGRQFVRQLQLAGAAHRAVAASRAKSRLLASISHELRTPLQTIIGFASVLLRRNTTAELTDKEMGYLERIGGNGRLALSVANDLQDLARVEAGRIEIGREPIDVGVVLRDVVPELRTRASDAGATLTVSQPEVLVPIRLDPKGLRQLLVNLVSYLLAIVRKAAVSLELTTDPQGGTPRQLLLRATGEVPPKEREQAFEALAERTNRRSGYEPEPPRLGLAIAKDLCARMGIGLKGEVGTDSITISVLLP